jgi:hemerythrin-like metal-binding protein/PAS domain S-box-containing protein
MKRIPPKDIGNINDLSIEDSEIRYRRLFEAAQDGILILDAKSGMIKDVNPFLIKMLGYSRDEFIKRKLWEVGAFKDIEASQDAFESLQENEYIRYENLPLKAKDGRLVQVEFVSNVYKVGSEKVIQCNIRDITARKNAEDALRKSEESYLNTLKNMKEGFQIIDFDWRYHFVNKAAEDQGKRKKEDLLGHTMMECYPGIEKTDMFTALVRCMDSRLPQTIVNEFNYPDGSSRWFELSIQPSPTGIHILSNDITDRKQANDVLQKSEKRFRAIVEHSLEEISLIDSDGILTYESPTSRNPLGYPPNAFVGHNLTDLIHPDEKAAAAQLLEQIVSHPGIVHEASFRLQHQDGSWHWMESSLSNLLDEPAVQSIVINYRDVTEQKMAAVALRESAERNILQASLLNQVHNAVIATDLDGKIFYWNKFAETLYQWKADEVIGKHIQEVTVPEDAGGLSENIFDSIQKIGYWEGEFFVNRKDGSLFPALVLDTLIKNSEGTVIGILGVSTDITERKQAEEKIINSNNELSMLFELSHSLAEADNLEDILSLVNRHAVESVHTTFARIALLEDNSYIVRAVYPLRPLDHDLRLGDRNPIVELPHTQGILEKNEPIILRDNDPGITDEEKKALLLDFAQSICIVPLRVNDSSPMSAKFMGMLMLGEARNEGREPFTPEKMRLAQTIGDAAAISIQRMLLREQTERRLQQLIATSEIDLAIISSPDLDTSLGVLLSQTIEQLKVDAADVWVFNPTSQSLEFVVGQGFQTTAFQNASPLHLGEGIAGLAALERQTIHIANLEADIGNPRLANALKKEPFISYYAVPLIVKNELKGVLELFHRSELESNEEWLNFLHSLANQAAIAIDNSSLFNELIQSNTELIQAYDATIQGWSRALDLRDNETEGHTQRVTELTLQLGRQFGLSEEKLIHVRRGALLHDIGKMGVPDGILLKPGPLTNEEWVVMRQHATNAYDLLFPIHFLRPAMDIPYCHHEKWDGTGYPRGLKGDQIPFAARIFAVVDVWDALTSNRPYRAAWSEEKTLNHIRALSGTHFDPQVVNVCLDSGLLQSHPKMSRGLEPMQWSEKFSVGVLELDQQHQQLFKLVNRLIAATGTLIIHSETISDILGEMILCSQTHFATEEWLMEFYGYSGLEEQKEQHNDFRKKTTDFIKNAALGDEQIPEVLLKFLTHWLNQHILEDDMAFQQFFKEKGVE